MVGSVMQCCMVGSGGARESGGARVNVGGARQGGTVMSLDSAREQFGYVGGVNQASAGRCEGLWRGLALDVARVCGGRRFT